MATIRDGFLVDVPLYADLDFNRYVRLRSIQDQIKKHRWCCIRCTKGAPDILGKAIYTRDTIMALKKAFLKFRKGYIPPNIPKLVVDS